MALDFGGVRRQFFSNLLQEVTLSTSLNLFERNDLYLLPSINQEAYICGHYKMLGKLILHSILQEGPGFPYFPPSLYYYICTGSVEVAIEYLSLETLPFHSKIVVDEVNS